MQVFHKVKCDTVSRRDIRGGAGISTTEGDRCRKTLALQSVPRIPGITHVMLKNVLTWQDLNSSSVNGENN